jgi:hypothetical protein
METISILLWFLSAIFGVICATKKSGRVNLFRALAWTTFSAAVTTACFMVFYKDLIDASPMLDNGFFTNQTPNPVLQEPILERWVLVWMGTIFLSTVCVMATFFFTRLIKRDPKKGAGTFESALAIAVDTMIDEMISEAKKGMTSTGVGATTPRPNATPINFNISVPHRLPQEDALARVQGLLTKVKTRESNKVSNLSEEWNGNNGSFSFQISGRTITGNVTVLENEVKISGHLPGVLSMFKGRIRQTIISEAEAVLV